MPIVGELIGSREVAIEELARTLHSKMEHLEPTEDFDWDRLNERQQEFYRLCVEGLLSNRRHLGIALGLPGVGRQR
jgi:hypothetical protein